MKALLHPLLLLLLTLVSISCLPVYAGKKAYIVYLGGHSHGLEATPKDWNRAAESHHQLLASIFGRCTQDFEWSNLQFHHSMEAARSSIFYSYTKHINGFAARLDEEEAMRVSEHPAVISVFKNRAVGLHTTRTWDFMGGTLDQDGKVKAKSIWAKADLGEDIIIANIDTGVWPESESFDDEGYGPVPQKWKGVCQNDSSEHSFSCNRKLIGARSYPLGHPIDDPSPRDEGGHGTHTLSTAGGNFVGNASLFGNGLGTARGGAPRARVAAYKACWSMCSDVALLAAFDDAIADGVDVISLSVGGGPTEYVADSIALGSFHAVQSGIVVAASAGNEGPDAQTVTNVAPWILTVGASTVDREFASFVTLGDNSKIQGVSLASKSLPADEFYPLIDGADAKLPNTSEYEAGFCYPGSLDQDKVKGKIVMCTRDMMYARVTKGLVVSEAGGAGMILANDDFSPDDVLADAHFLPASAITYLDAGTVRDYLQSTESPTASISPTATLLDVKPAPSMVFFSSRGPNVINSAILKPDITAPGVNVLAAFSMGIGPSMLPEDDRRVGFNVMSGTSMSCPHIAGVAGLVKKIHPDWSPAAIKSAIMTTARTRDNTGTTMKESKLKSTPLDYGAGHVRPNRAMDPGLVYDLSISDYIDFLCTRSYNSSGMGAFIGKSYTCPSEHIAIENFNYPTITIPFVTGSFTVTRTVKNVGDAPATYRARVQAPYGIAVEVAPEVLEFASVGEEKTFKVTVRSSKASVGVGYVFGRLIWSDGVHHVRSPLVVKALL